MDFGDILNQWDEIRSEAAKGEREKKNTCQVSRKKPNAPTLEEKLAAEQKKAFARIVDDDPKKGANFLDLWLDAHGTVDKDAQAAAFNERTKMKSREHILKMRPDDRIDLHGLTRDEAWARLEKFVSDCVSRGFRKILIVHGKGNHSPRGSDPVLGQLVRTFIEQDRRLGASGHPDGAQGGTGATWVIIK